jgi:hypothetical protein
MPWDNRGDLFLLTMRHSVFFRESVKAKPFFGLMTNSTVERAFASITISVTTVADVMPVTG